MSDESDSGSRDGPASTSASASTPAPAAARPGEPTKAAGEIDPSFYTWTNLFKLMLGTEPDMQQARTRYLAAKDVANEQRDCSRCEKTRDELFASSPIIRFMRSEISKIGPDLGPAAVHCRRCPADRPQAGGFDLDHGILLCANELRTRARIEDTLAHELVHAYDWARWHVRPDSLRHQACTEVRASALSGECRFTREFFGRAQYRLTGQFQECVRRRATLSLMARPQVAGDREKAARAVEDVWESCFPDTRPFDEIFR